MKRRAPTTILAPSLLLLLGISGSGAAMTSPQDAAEGQALFQSKCAVCHSVGTDRVVGPGLAGVTTTRDRDWLERFITEPDQVLASGDPIAAALLEEYQVPMPNLGTTDAEAEASCDSFRNG